MGHQCHPLRALPEPVCSRTSPGEGGFLNRLTYVFKEGSRLQHYFLEVEAHVAVCEQLQDLLEGLQALTDDVRAGQVVQASDHGLQYYLLVLPHLLETRSLNLRNCCMRIWNSPEDPRQGDFNPRATISATYLDLCLTSWQPQGVG